VQIARLRHCTVLSHHVPFISLVRIILYDLQGCTISIDSSAAADMELEILEQEALAQLESEMLEELALARKAVS
jgi:hypothetical protein